MLGQVRRYLGLDPPMPMQGEEPADQAAQVDHLAERQSIRAQAPSDGPAVGLDDQAADRQHLAAADDSQARAKAANQVGYPGLLDGGRGLAVAALGLDPIDVPGAKRLGLHSFTCTVGTRPSIVHGSAPRTSMQ